MPFAVQSAATAQVVTASEQVFKLHVPGVHVALELQAWPAGALHSPQSLGTRQTVALLLHVPLFGQSVSLVQTTLGLR